VVAEFGGLGGTGAKCGAIDPGEVEGARHSAEFGIEGTDKHVSGTDPATPGRGHTLHSPLEQELRRFADVRIAVRISCCRRQLRDLDRDPGDGQAAFPLTIERDSQSISRQPRLSE
jgi:hypothetical protein